MTDPTPTPHTLETLRAVGIEEWCLGLATTTSRVQAELDELRSEVRNLRTAGPLPALADDPVPIPELRCRRLVVVDDDNIERIIAEVGANSAQVAVFGTDGRDTGAMLTVVEPTAGMDLDDDEVDAASASVSVSCGGIIVGMLDTGRDGYLTLGRGGSTHLSSEDGVCCERLTVVDEDGVERIVAYAEDNTAWLRVQDQDRRSVVSLMSLDEPGEEPCAGVAISRGGTEHISIDSDTHGGTMQVGRIITTDGTGHADALLPHRPSQPPEPSAERCDVQRAARLMLQMVRYLRLTESEFGVPDQSDPAERRAADHWSNLADRAEKAAWAIQDAEQAR